MSETLLIDDVEQMLAQDVPTEIIVRHLTDNLNLADMTSHDEADGLLCILMLGSRKPERRKVHPDDDQSRRKLALHYIAVARAISDRVLREQKAKEVFLQEAFKNS